MIYINIGSNLDSSDGDRLYNLKKSIDLIKFKKCKIQKISKIYETPIGQYALSEIVNGKKLNYHIITLVKICNVLKVKPQSIVESDSLDMELLKPEYIKYLKKNKETLDSATIPSNKEQMKDNMEIVINNVLFKEDESSLEEL